MLVVQIDCRHGDVRRADAAGHAPRNVDSVGHLAAEVDIGQDKGVAGRGLGRTPEVDLAAGLRATMAWWAGATALPDPLGWPMAAH